MLFHKTKNISLSPAPMTKREASKTVRRHHIQYRFSKSDLARLSRGDKKYPEEDKQDHAPDDNVRVENMSSIQSIYLLSALRETIRSKLSNGG